MEHPKYCKKKKKIFKHCLNAYCVQSPLQDTEREAIKMRKLCHSWPGGGYTSQWEVSVYPNKQHRMLWRRENHVWGSLWPQRAFKNQGKKEGQYLHAAGILNGHRTVNMMVPSILKTELLYCSSEDWEETENMNTQHKKDLDKLEM